MKKWNYYNDNDPFACAWARELIKAGLVPDGEVDERSITDVHPDELRGFVQCHFFCGILGWSLALRLAGWDDSRPVWTGSCPCQPFSVAGKSHGVGDERHLWPAFLRLITECVPPVVFGEQVASADGRLWLAGVRVDLEGLGYAVGAADLCAAGVGAPHIRQRLYWVADALRDGTGRAAGSETGAARATTGAGCGEGQGGTGASTVARSDSASFGLANRNGRGRLGPEARPDAHTAEHGLAAERGDPRGLADAGCLWHRNERPGADTGAPEGVQAAPAQRERLRAEPGECGDGASFWSSAVWLPCRDGKARRVEPSIFPLADGVPNRVGTLRGAGNAIVPPLAAEFVKAFTETKEVTNR